MDKLEFAKAVVYVGKDKTEMAEAAAQHFAKVTVEAVKARGICSVALSGGSSPPLVYERLLSDDLHNKTPWDKIHYFIGDERCVPDDSPENNFNVARHQLISKVNPPAENLHPLLGQDNDPAEAALRYEEEIKKFFSTTGSWSFGEQGAPASKEGASSGRGTSSGDDEKFPVFDLIWLGMGPDGHCASLFPGTKALTEVKRLVVENFVEKLSANRITFTFPFINHARSIMFVSNGEDKAAVLAEALTSDVIKYPVQHVVLAHGKAEWFVDLAAAKELCASAESRH
jgi:6-phosphogluconolactonase